MTGELIHYAEHNKEVEICTARCRKETKKEILLQSKYH